MGGARVLLRTGQYDGRMAAFRRILVALLVVMAVQAPARSDHLNAREGDWFLVILTAGPNGATDFEATYSTSGRLTGDPMVFGGAISDGESAGGGVSGSFGPGLRVGLAGAASLEIDILPAGGTGTIQSVHTTFGDEMKPGERIFSLSFVSGTVSRASTVAIKTGSGSITAETIPGKGAKAILLLETSEGLAVEGAVAGAAVSASFPVNSPGLVGGFTSCLACLAEWTSPDGRSGVNQTGSWAFGGPAGRWQLSWSGVSNPGLALATVGGYAPIGEYWKHFPFGPGLLG